MRVLVAGDGVAGLVAARSAALAGAEATVLGAGRPGGQVRGEVVDGLRLDVGAEGFATRGAAVATLAADLGLDVVLPVAAGTRVARGGVTQLIPPASLLGLPADLDDPLLDLPAAALAQARRLDAAPVRDLPETLGGLARTRFGDAVAEAFVVPLVRGVHGLDADNVPSARLAPGLAEACAARGGLAAAVRSLLAERGPALAGIGGGAFALVEALLADLARLGVPVLDEPALAVGPREVRTATGTRAADAVIAAVDPAAAPADTGRTVVTYVLEPLPAELSRIGLIRVDRDGGPSALTWSGAKWTWLAEAAAGREVLRLTYPHLHPPDPDADLAALLGATPTIRARHVQPWPDATSSVPPPDGVLPTGAHTAGRGLAAVVADALETGRRAARSAT